MNATQVAALLTMQKMEADRILAIVRSRQPEILGAKEWVVEPKKGQQPSIGELMTKVNPEP